MTLVCEPEVKLLEAQAVQTVALPNQTNKGEIPKRARRKDHSVTLMNTMICNWQELLLQRTLFRLCVSSGSWHSCFKRDEYATKNNAGKYQYYANEE